MTGDDTVGELQPVTCPNCLSETGDWEVGSVAYCHNNGCSVYEFDRFAREHEEKR